MRERRTRPTQESVAATERPHFRTSVESQIRAEAPEFQKQARRPKLSGGLSELSRHPRAGFRGGAFAGAKQARNFVRMIRQVTLPSSYRFGGWIYRLSGEAKVPAARNR